MLDQPVLQRNIELNSLLYTYGSDKNYSRIIIKSLLQLKSNPLKAGQQINECFEYLLDNEMIELAEQFFVSVDRSINHSYYVQHPEISDYFDKN